MRLQRILQGALALTMVFGGYLGCRGDTSRVPPIHLNPNMDTQDKYKSYRKSLFFEDGRQMRTPLVNTIARGKLRGRGEMNSPKERQEYEVWSGKSADDGSTWLTAAPYKQLTEHDLQRGQERYNIYCAPCHARDGYGKGPVALRSGGAINPPSYHLPYMGEKSAGEMFDIISNGSKSKLMPAYRRQIVDPKDRWRIVAYVRALQISQSARTAQYQKAGGKTKHQRGTK
jgi:mono/diheme cytochrome c family protein